MTEICIRKPDDWHVHLRDGDLLKLVLPYTARHFGKALIMPNLVPPIVTSSDAKTYQEEIVGELDGDTGFQPLMTLYLTEDTDPQDVERGIKSGLVKAVKLYPAGATTNSANGVRDFTKIYDNLELLTASNVPLCVHGEIVDHAVDIFDREVDFIKQVLTPIHKLFPDLKLVLEHISSLDAINFINNTPENVAATITVHHLVITRNHIFDGGIRPHYFCLPIAKREIDRQYLLKSATSANPSFFLGTDSAPHTVGAKISECGCAGIFTAPVALPILAQLFDEEGALDRLEGFTSLFGARFYGEPVNPSKITLQKTDTPLQQAATIVSKDLAIAVFDPEIDVYWQVKE